MSDKELQTVTVNILDREYQVSCPAEEVEDLEASAKHLDSQMRKIRTGGKVIGLERIAVMAALNITHELLNHSEKSDIVSQGDSEQVRRLTSKIDNAINFYRQLEI
jgi:cell division protein ZapA